jgi:hypothetical protein
MPTDDVIVPIDAQILEISMSKVRRKSAKENARRKI